MQFLVQLAAGIVIAIGVGAELGEQGPSYLTMWGELDQAQPGFSSPFSGEYTMLWAVLYLFVKSFEYSGGNWNLAARFISTATPSEARKAALLSAAMYLVWPLLIFAPMWAARLLFPGLEDPAAELYPLLTQTYLPHGLVGLVLAAMFAATMGMTVSDINTLAAVTQRDIAPALSARFRSAIADPRRSLTIARVVTVAFTVATLLVGLNANSFGGVLSLVISWFGAMVGVTGVPLLLGLFGPFRRTDGSVVIVSVLAGFATFAVTKLVPGYPADWEVASPLIVSTAVFVLGGYVVSALGRPERPEAREFLAALEDDRPAPELADRAG